eukprot:TRINITY_DN4226_c0_g1_i1.p1 TRINITY_DN4226_c0_g1~~TRINITY_DN4226_c0_g1_i1.p1  ORF type:complete len:737 (-),score=141.71 TRINITY_DN4226_c0_g1_i1:219-2309(-)
MAAVKAFVDLIDSQQKQLQQMRSSSRASFRRSSVSKASAAPADLIDKVREEMLQLIAANAQALAAGLAEACVNEVWAASFACLAAPQQVPQKEAPALPRVASPPPATGAYRTISPPPPSVVSQLSQRGSSTPPASVPCQPPSPKTSVSPVDGFVPKRPRPGFGQKSFSSPRTSFLGKSSGPTTRADGLASTTPILKQVTKAIGSPTKGGVTKPSISTKLAVANAVGPVSPSAAAADMRANAGPASAMRAAAGFRSPSAQASVLAAIGTGGKTVVEGSVSVSLSPSTPSTVASEMYLKADAEAMKHLPASVSEPASHQDGALLLAAVAESKSPQPPPPPPPPPPLEQPNGVEAPQVNARKDGDFHPVAVAESKSPPPQPPPPPPLEQLHPRETPKVSARKDGGPRLSGTAEAKPTPPPPPPPPPPQPQVPAVPASTAAKEKSRPAGLADFETPPVSPEIKAAVNGAKDVLSDADSIDKEVEALRRTVAALEEQLCVLGAEVEGTARSIASLAASAGFDVGVASSDSSGGSPSGFHTPRSGIASGDGNPAAAVSGCVAFDGLRRRYSDLSQCYASHVNTISGPGSEVPSSPLEARRQLFPEQKFTNLEDADEFHVERLALQAWLSEATECAEVLLDRRDHLRRLKAQLLNGAVVDPAVVTAALSAVGPLSPTSRQSFADEGRLALPSAKTPVMPAVGS